MKKAISITLDKDVIKYLIETSKKEGISKSEIINRVLRKILKGGKR